MRTLTRRLLSAIRQRYRDDMHAGSGVIGKGFATYADWVSRYSTIGPAQRRRLIEAQQKCGTLSTVTVLVDAQGASREQIALSLRSIREQTYVRWDIVVVNPPDDSRVLDRAQAVAVYRNKQNSGVSLKELLDVASGAVIVPMVAGDLLSPAALTAFVLAFDAWPNATALYADEDRVDASGHRSDPWFKGAWSPDQLLAQAYTLRACAFRRGTVLEASQRNLALDSVMEAAYAIWLSMAADDDAKIHHLPFVLYHRRRDASQVEPHAFVKLAQESLLAHKYGFHVRTDNETDFGWRRVVWPTPLPPQRISLCVPTRDRHRLLSNCVEGLRHRTHWQDLEIIIVDNGSVEAETHAYLDSLAVDARVTVLRDDGEFNFSRLNNLGARAATGAVFGLINNDLEVKEPGWLREMVSHAVRPDVGAVGALLHYGNDTVQHAGVVLGIGGIASHVHKGLPDGLTGYNGRVVIAQDVSCVTAACLLTRLEIYQRLGGLDEQRLPVAYNDVDFCLRVRAAGLRVIYTPHAHLYHLESASRGLDSGGAKRARLEQDKAAMRDRWSKQIADDPFYSPNLSNTATDCRLAFPPRVVFPWGRLGN